MVGSFEESTREKEDVQAGKEAQATVCDWKPESQDQSWKIQRKGVRFVVMIWNTASRWEASQI